MSISFHLGQYNISTDFPFIRKKQGNYFYKAVEHFFSSFEAVGQVFQGIIIRVALFSRTFFDSYIYSFYMMLPGVHPPKRTYLQIAHDRIVEGLENFKKNPVKFFKTHYILTAVIIIRIALALFFAYYYLVSSCVQNQ